jgi:hypothetical protein
VSGPTVFLMGMFAGQMWATLLWAVLFPLIK